MSRFKPNLVFRSRFSVPVSEIGPVMLRFIYKPFQILLLRLAFRVQRANLEKTGLKPELNGTLTIIMKYPVTKHCY